MKKKRYWPAIIVAVVALVVGGMVDVAIDARASAATAALEPLATTQVLVDGKVETIAIVDWLRECWIVSADGGVSLIGPHLDDACLAIRDAIAARAKQP